MLSTGWSLLFLVFAVAGVLFLFHSYSALWNHARELRDRITALEDEVGHLRARVRRLEDRPGPPPPGGPSEGITERPGWRG